MHLNLAKFKIGFFIVLLLINFEITNLYSQGADENLASEEIGIYLPFPEFKDPEKKQEESIANEIKPDDASKENSLTTKNKSTITTKPKAIVTSKNISTTPNKNLSIQSKVNSASNEVKPQQSKKTLNTKNKSKINPSDQNPIQNSKNNSEPENPTNLNNDSSSELEMDITEYNKSLEKIRNIEAKDPEKAIQEYKTLLTRYTNSPILAQLNLYIAWNYFHRNKNSDCLEHLVAILDIPEILDSQEYPTALYLAGRVHERNWKGSNRDFAVRYYEIFLQNYKSGKENFTKSFYYPKVQEQLKSLNPNRSI